MSSLIPKSKYLYTKLCATRIGLASHILEKWRSQGRGPPFVYLGLSVRYRWWEVEQWVDSQSATNTICSAVHEG